jgi:hypothetical protein
VTNQNQNDLSWSDVVARVAPRQGAARRGNRNPRCERQQLISKLETAMTRWYWRQVGGTLCEEYLAVRKAATCGQRRLDAVIIPSGRDEVVHWRHLNLEGLDVIVVQTKARRLGMHLMGQTFFSAELVRKHGARSVRSVALCTADDAVLRPLLERHEGMESW